MMATMGDGGDNDPLASDYEIEGTIDATDDDGDSETMMIRRP